MFNKGHPYIRITSLEERDTVESMDEFRRLIAALRGENGCPWDKKQTVQSMSRYLLEEAQEAFEEIEKNCDEGLCEELGDVLLIIVMLSQIAEEGGRFTFDDVVQGVSDKIIRRHPHVFGDVQLNTAEEVLANWKEIKRREKMAREKS
jgi:tetrapyrrole methylase family protein/MazG family protein